MRSRCGALTQPLGLSTAERDQFMTLDGGRESVLVADSLSYIGINGMWRSLVAHFVRDEGAAGSNLSSRLAGWEPSVCGR